LRLTEKGHSIGLVGDMRWRAFCEKREAIEKAHQALHETWVRVGHNDALKAVLETPLQHDCRASDLLKRPEITYAHMQAVEGFDLPVLTSDVADLVETQVKYAGYIERQKLDIERLQKHENTKLPTDIDYASVSGLSTEVMQKLSSIRPVSIGHAGRISGVTPAALSLLLMHLKKQRVEA
jgi:tRNA uridine 5-carboxymethylaminomethyl modification enzyme